MARIYAKAWGRLSKMVTTLSLPERLDLVAARPLARDIAAIDSDIRLDATDVKFLGGLCLQIILATRQHCAASDRAFTITNASAAFTDALHTFGASPALLNEGMAA